ncbi:hypothetical protein LGH82_29490 [Mesorhizobium sp. PAMC28654]|uniref:hypothetical protein n=1 Tax=Mesorhizobium sp. PAMC28654 TaxID=2880934 RepID=UPI001D0B3E5E|nr:hypothetical protein [Mesorhizobium sp. PAMC28654]UDL89160.1 hypothetical protein LGH82_29490 [Mesorhizobium sp. PAMC28654]
MKTLLIASLIAVTSATAFIAPASAASLIINPDGAYVDQNNGDNYYPRRHRDYYDENAQYQGDNGYRRHHRHNCRIEQVVHWRHHHRVVEEVRVCG